jgi:hypothetical protein
VAVNNPYVWGTGRRKTSTARVRIKPGTGKFLINGREFEAFFVTVGIQIPRIFHDSPYTIYVLFCATLRDGKMKTLILCWFLVLPVRIELTTSPLPRECSTTELRQRRAGCE